MLLFSTVPYIPKFVKAEIKVYCLQRPIESSKKIVLKLWFSKPLEALKNVTWPFVAKCKIRIFRFHWARRDFVP